ncbi:MAG: DUF5606 domain-containing protein [Bacteroidales bacterium]|nr:DUF5606 domain-containing protein [Bacteroidales bacterium]
MDLSKVVAISGKPGLFLVSSQGAGKLIVESLLDGKKTPAFANDKISSLEEISIFTTGEDKPLKDVFMSIYEKMGDKLDFDPKKATPVELREKFLVVLPDYDEDAVYQSDMKKVFQWYQLLNDKKLLDFTVEKKEEEKLEEAPAEKKAAKKTTTKKAAPKAAPKENVKAAAAPATKSTKKPKKV